MTQLTQSDGQSTNTPVKSIEFMIKFLSGVWFLWIFYRIFLFPFFASHEDQQMLHGVLWQIITTLPALLFTSAVIKAKSPYALIITNLIVLLYFAGSCAFCVIHFYANNYMMGLLFFGESAMLLMINIALFLLLKRLPPMYKYQSM